MEGTLIKSIAWAASLGTVVAAALFFSLARVERPELVPEAAPVKHSNVTDAPKTAEVRETTDVKTMVASYYDGSLAGSPTASGDVYRPERLTAAHKSLPLGTELKISYGGESVEVVVNDRGPYVPGHELDLSYAAAQAIGLVGPGVAPVHVTVR